MATMDEMTMKTLKQMKEDFVSNLSGGSISEINTVTAVALSAYALWAAIQTRTRATDCRIYGLPAFILDTALNSICLLFSITTYSSHSVLLNILLLTPAFVLYLQPPFSLDPKEKVVESLRKQEKPVKKESTHAPKVTSPSNHKPFVTAYRGGMMVITCLAILAVDFKVFPRRFAKAELFGTSLMDMGVGSFVFSSGLVSSRQPQTSPLKQIYTALRASASILALGIIRTILTKNIEYQEHVTEYGVHWNFFVTLGLLPVSVTFIRLTSRNKLPFSIFAGIISVGYQWCLDHVKIREYDTISKFIVLGSRDDLFGQNREGIFSFFGYLSIFLVGLDIGRLILPANPPAMRYFKTSPSGLLPVFVSLLVCSIVSIAAFLISTKYFGMEVGRRFANLPYVLWVIAYNTTFLLGYLLIQILFFGLNTPHVEAVPYTLEAINRNGLALFLLANVLTGLVNMTINTLETSNIQAMAVLTLYALVINAVAAGLRYKGWTIKI